MLSIGLMSGTSMDGIDAALLETDGESQVRALAHVSLAYSSEFKTALKAAESAVRSCEGDWSAVDLSHVTQHSTYLHAEIVQALLARTGYAASEIDVVGYHGQTLFHQPHRGISVIIGDGTALSQRVGITVVNDFRRQDIEEGGQGAPFAPLYHRALAMRDSKIPVAIVNCGGIANLTLISGSEIKDLCAFDTGPGNALLDQIVRQRTQNREHMDEDGRYGKKGKVNSSVLDILLQHPYLTRTPPKSLDYGDFALIAALDPLSLEDACATLATFTAETIVRSMSLVDVNPPTEWILAGGGWHHPVIRGALETRLQNVIGKHVKISTADEIGWHSQAMEAQTFAYLAVRALQQKPLSFPNTTGVSHPVTGGTISHSS